MYGTGPATAVRERGVGCVGGGVRGRVRRPAGACLREGGVRCHRGPGACGRGRRQRGRRGDPGPPARDRRPPGQSRDRRAARASPPRCARSPPAPRSTTRAPPAASTGTTTATCAAATSACGGSPRTKGSKKQTRCHSPADLLAPACSARDTGLTAIVACECSRRLRQHVPRYDKDVDARKFTKERVAIAVQRALTRDNPPCVDWPRRPGQTTVYRLVGKLLDA